MLRVLVRAGGPGVVPDSRVQTGAAAAAATDGAAGKRRRQGAAGEVHQHHAGHCHRDLGVRFHSGQVHRPAAAQPPPPGTHLRGRVRVSAAVEELGTFAVRFGTIGPPALIWEGKQDRKNPGPPWVQVREEFTCSLTPALFPRAILRLHDNFIYERSGLKGVHTKPFPQCT